MKLGSLFSGAAGLDRAVEHVFGATTVWHSEIDPAASKVLAHHYPGVPNLGSITDIDWASVEPVDILCGGYPCQPFSAAGQRKGTSDARHLWPHFAEAIRRVRPRYVILENVAGHRSMGFDSVLADLARDGYDAQWCSVRASDVGAPHRRERLFVIAHPRNGDVAERARAQGREAGKRSPVGSIAGCGSDKPVDLLPTPQTADGTGGHLNRSGSRSDELLLPGVARAYSNGDLLPTPVVNDMGDGKTVEWWDQWTADAKQRHGNGNGHGNSLAIEVQRNLLPTPTSRDGKGHNQRGDTTCLTGALLPTPSTHDGTGARTPEQLAAMTKPFANLNDTAVNELLPTPSASDGIGGGPNNPNNRLAQGHHVQLLDMGMASTEMWGKYGPAIARWEQLTRPAPAPTEPNSKGNPRLNAAFSEWMMGWPAGWVTAVPGISRNDALRIVGNGVVSQQAVAALSFLLTVCGVAA